MGLFLLLLAIPLRFLLGDVSAVYLSWYGDPATTMTVQWHMPLEEKADLELQVADETWTPAAASRKALGPVSIHTVELARLLPDTEYVFRIAGHSKTYKFRTAPTNLDRPLRFLIGGDAYANTKLFRRMSRTAAETDPLFAVIGGDIAYALGSHPFQLKSSPLRRWLRFLREWTEQMATPDGRLIPFLLVPGNHDLRPDNAELFFQLFAFPEKRLYRTMDFGGFLSLVLLDTGHFSPIEGEQSAWLEQTLAERDQTRFVFPVYHVAAYPSFYPFNSAVPQTLRTLWCPLFEQYGVTAAFENHNHNYKRTFRMKEGRIDPDGIVYLGDGCWGTVPRVPRDLWYLEKKLRRNHVFLLELKETKGKIQAIDLLGETFDELIVFPKRASNVTIRERLLQSQTQSRAERR